MRSRPVELRDGVNTFPDPDEGACDFMVANEDGVMVPQESLTRQSEAVHTDINVLMAQYERSGTLPVMEMEALYEDVSSVGDYRSMMDAVNAAQEAFMSQPAKVRNRFENDPGKFLAFVDDPANAEELYVMGLRVKPDPVVDPPPMKVEVVSPKA